MEDVQKKLNAMVEDGDITQEEAEAKLKALRAKEADRAATR
jgi:polyhydroxyalkanoate synthesis regulator phasin